MTTILDSGGVSALASDRALIKKLRLSGEWPPIVPADVLAESLTGDHRRDHDANHLLGLCLICPVTEGVARHAATLRFRAQRKDISAVDAIVAATADRVGGGVVWTSDPTDLGALAGHTTNSVKIAAV
ncbi:MAG TPA: PIN domain-containing protein [Actinophytocola sp.]|uniref:type II toxin-antitoxin system VapC family toxin n=1 Tax=Actinophytocola sp. TaxID=1872138 RepID=UPI002E07392A|nr:PIN domain-containing protein [Actinophytocola sp.]